MASSATTILGYGQPPSQKVRRWLRWVIVIAILAVVGWSSSEFGTTLWRRVALSVVERRAVSYVPAEGHIIMKGGPFHQAPFGKLVVQPWLDVPAAWTSYAKAVGLEDAPPLFVGELKSPSGHLRTVIIQLRGDRPATIRASDRVAVLFIFFQAYVRTSASFWSESRSASPPHGPFPLKLPMGKSFEVFAGRVGPADRGHLTIEYQNDGDPGTIDGWLLDDDNLRLVLRDGPAEQER